MDIVYVCRSGDNEELRYSLRSLKNITYNNIFIFGDAPSWCNINTTKINQNKSSYANVYNSLVAICNDERISDNFMLWNDDFFALRPIDTIDIYNIGLLKDVIKSYELRRVKTSYTKTLKKTLSFLQEQGYDNPLCNELHIPMIYNKAKLKHVLDITKHDPDIQKRTVYCALYCIESTQIEDVKIYKRADEIINKNWLSCNEQSFKYIYPALKHLFPNKSQYEKTPN